MSREELRGRAAGVMVGAVFGLVWAASALPALGAFVAASVVVVSVATVVVLMAGARRLRCAAAALPASAPPGPGMRRVQRHFALVVAGEGVLILAAASLLAASGHSQWIPAAVCAAVGLHFVPLARLFRVREYYATAAALWLVAATTMVLGAAGAPAPLWKVLPGLGAALALWATSSSLLKETKRTQPGGAGRSPELRPQGDTAREES